MVIAVRAATCVCLALSLGACGRLGFDPLDLDEGDPPFVRDGGGQRPPDDGGETSPPELDGGPTAEAGTPGMDSGPMPGMDAALDAALDAAADAAADATTDEDTGSEDAGPRCAAPTTTSFCDALPSLPEAPVLDGTLECGLTLQPVTVQRWTKEGVNPVPAGHGARWAAGWRPDGLYVFVDVDDASRLPALSTAAAWCGDGVEVYLDDDGSYAAAPAYDDPGTVQLVAVAPDTDTTMVVRGDRYRSAVTLAGGWMGSNFATYPKPGGYVLEAFVAAADLDLASWSLAAGQRVGIDLGLNLSVSAEPPPSEEMPDCGRRLGQYFLHSDETDPACTDNLCKPWRNPAAFCTPQLSQ